MKEYIEKIKERIKNIDMCKVFMIGYHLLFLGGSTTLINGYVDKIDLLRQEIVIQMDRADIAVSKIDKSIIKVGKSIDKVDSATTRLTSDLRKVQKACKRLF